MWSSSMGFDACLDHASAQTAYTDQAPRFLCLVRSKQHALQQAADAICFLCWSLIRPLDLIRPLPLLADKLIDTAGRISLYLANPLRSYCGWFSPLYGTFKNQFVATAFRDRDNIQEQLRKTQRRVAPPSTSLEKVGFSFFGLRA